MTLERSRFGTLQTRLLLAFAGVAMLAIAVFALLVLFSSRGDVRDLVRKQQMATVDSTAATLADAYQEAGSWSEVDFRSARALSASSGAALEVRDASGKTVFVPGGGAGRGRSEGARRGTGPSYQELGAAKEAPVVVAGERVGTVALRFPKNALPPAERQLRDSLTRTTLVGTGIALLVALAVGTLVAGWIRRPLKRLIVAVRSLERGERGARTNLSAPGELGELAAALDRMASSLEREDELRKAFVSSVAHELRTPVTVLRAECESILEGVSEPTPARISSLHDEVLRLGRAVEDLETLASAEAASLRLERRPLDLASVAGEVVELYQSQYAAAEVELLVHSKPVTVEGDTVRLAQVIRNLLANALKFTPAGGRVEVTVEPGRGEARLVVADNGRGIRAEDLPYVFERFWRSESARGTSGSGIGLAVVDELVRAHGGRVEVASEGGEGSVFTVFLPLA